MQLRNALRFIPETVTYKLKKRSARKEHSHIIERNSSFNTTNEQGRYGLSFADLYFFNLQEQR